MSEVKRWTPAEHDGSYTDGYMVAADDATEDEDLYIAYADYKAVMIERYRLRQLVAAIKSVSNRREVSLGTVFEIKNLIRDFDVT